MNILNPCSSLNLFAIQTTTDADVIPSSSRLCSWGRSRLVAHASAWRLLGIQRFHRCGLIRRALAFAPGVGQGFSLGIQPAQKGALAPEVCTPSSFAKLPTANPQPTTAVVLAKPESTYWPWKPTQTPKEPPSPTSSLNVITTPSCPSVSTFTATTGRPSAI